MPNKSLFMALFMVMLPLYGCMNVPARDMEKPVDLGSVYKTQNLSNQDLLPENIGWWEIYGDLELNSLMKYAFANNPNIAQMRARLSQAKALTRQSRSSLMPSLNITTQRDTYNGNNAPNSDFSLIGAASFEIDLWGKNRSETNANILQSQASTEDIYAAKISLSAAIVNNWLDILSLLEQESIINKQIATNKTILELQHKRFEMGTASALDVLQQEENLASVQSKLPDILSLQEQTANNIAQLLGNAPHKNLKITAKKFPDVMPLPDNGIPSDLLENRPDIIASWLRLRSADWAKKAAMAKRLPSFNLSATYTTSATFLDALFNSWLLNLAANVAAPIFDGGARKAEQIRQAAIADERYHKYRETVIAAIVDVENALIRNNYQDQKLIALNKQMRAAKNTLEQANLSYINGKVSYINVLNSIKNTQILEQQIATEKLLQAKERVSLYRALGGRNWAMQASEK